MLSHPWMQGDISSENDITIEFTRRKNVVDTEAKNERDSKRAERHEAKETRAVRRGASGAEANYMSDNFVESLQGLCVHEYGPVYL